MSNLAFGTLLSSGKTEGSARTRRQRAGNHPFPWFVRQIETAHRCQWDLAQRAWHGSRSSDTRSREAQKALEGDGTARDGAWAMAFLWHPADTTRSHCSGQDQRSSTSLRSKPRVRLSFLPGLHGEVDPRSSSTPRKNRVFPWPERCRMSTWKTSGIVSPVDGEIWSL